MRGFIFCFILLCSSSICILSVSSERIAGNEALAEDAKQLFTTEGRATVGVEFQPKLNWQAETRVLLDYGKYIGFLRQDGSFEIQNVPSGSYILEVSNADFLFESVRIDITNKGKIRARRLNLLQPNSVSTIPYPLKLSARQPTKYFRVREEWRVTDVMMNPMVLMLIAAFFLMVLMPKLAGQDPQVQKEMQNIQLPKMDMPDMADMLANIFGSAGNKKNSRKPITGQTTKRPAR